MQPPLPRSPVLDIRREDDHRQPSASTHHPQEPADTAIESPPGVAQQLVGTCDPRLVQAWAEHHGGEPATGEATASGPATIVVNDQGSGLRFNFPGASRFREVTWDEWLSHFTDHGLVFVFEATPQDGTQVGARFGGAFFRVLSKSEWGNRPLATLAPDADQCKEA